MNVKEMIIQLQQLSADGYSEYELYDTNAYPIISAIVSEDDVDNNIHRVYIESEF
jgi:hypothetical protein